MYVGREIRLLSGSIREHQPYSLIAETTETLTGAEDSGLEQTNYTTNVRLGFRALLKIQGQQFSVTQRYILITAKAVAISSKNLWEFYGFHGSCTSKTNTELDNNCLRYILGLQTLK